MSIESSSTSNNPKIGGAAEHGSAKGKGKLKPDDEAAGLTGGGFLALMTALEPAADLGTGLDAAVTAQPGPVLPGLTPEPPEMLTGLAPEPVALSAAGLPNELAMLLAQAGAGSAGLAEPTKGAAPALTVPAGRLVHGLAPSTGTVPSEEPLVPAVAVDPAQTLPAMDALTAGAVAPGLVGAHALTAAKAGQTLAARANGRAVGTGTVKGQAESQIPTAALASIAADEPRAVNALLEQTGPSVTASPGKARSGGFQSGLAAALSDPRGLLQAGRADPTTGEPVSAPVLVSGEIGEALLKPAQRLANKFSGLVAGAGIEGAWGHQALLGGSRASASAALTSTPTQSLESMVADTVSYWTTQGIQNAELKLDGFGDEAVAVRISLKGDQAHIDFRTDQPEIRQMLEGALAQLKDVLKSEGLVLSGVSVGGSGQNGAGTQEQRERPDSGQSGQASPITPQAGPVPVRQRINPAVGQALDMFV